MWVYYWFLDLVKVKRRYRLKNKALEEVATGHN
jgi:hypothetical protein